MKQAGIPLFYLQGMGGGAVLKFRDLFNDDSLFWGWRKFLGGSEVGKSGVEENGSYWLRANEGIDATWVTNPTQAPRIHVGMLTYPCEIITRLDELSANENTGGGLFIAENAQQAGSDFIYSICQRNLAIGKHVSVLKDNALVVQDPNVVYPIWLRIRVGCGAMHSLRVFLDYSLDGLNWVNLYVHPEHDSGQYIFDSAPPTVGLYVYNWSPYHAIEGRFDFFQMKPKSIN